MHERAVFVGREAELAILRRLLTDDGPVVVFVHGIAGVGKSALLHEFAKEASVVALDGETIEPTPTGFLRALSDALGEDL
ncbi:MAG TPA: ATP-binding protein, partial [Solirubrobacter sp.]|nr:ATP-binding protein [Solirubrobacter sp.]